MFKLILQDSYSSILPIIGMLIFFGVFLVIVLTAYRTKKSKLDYMSELPLDKN